MIFGGLSTFTAILQHIWKTHVLVFIEEHYTLVIGYLIVSGALSFAVLYWLGPPTNPRSLDIVQWSMQVSFNNL